MKIKLFFKVIIFTLIFVLLVTSATSVLSVSMCPRSYNAITDFYQEDKNTADAVYIGSSNVLAYWNPMLAWEEYGIAVPNFACNAMPIVCLEYYLKEAHKRQPDAVYIMNINTLGEKGKTKVNKIHRAFVYSPFSFNKVQALYRFYDFYDIALGDMPEYSFPIIRFHSNWNNITDKDFQLEPNGFKGSDFLNGYLHLSRDFSDKYANNNDYVDVSEDLVGALNHLLDYCESEDLKVLFVTVPQAQRQNLISKYNTVNKIIKDRGFKTLELMDNIEDMNFDTSKDLYNNKHTNIHGSKKYTYYMSEYLIDNYGFEDKRNDENYSGWNDSLSKYMKVANTAILDFELDKNYDPTILDAPKHLKAEETDENISVKWDAVDGAEGYAVYKKAGLEGTWEKINETKELSLQDIDYISESEYYYRVVPFKKNDGKKAYGDFSYKGAYILTK